MNSLKRTRKPSAPRVIGLPQHRNVVHEVIKIADPEQPGKWINRKQGRRADNVFEALYTAGTINSEQRHAANELAEIYARSKGLSGIGERNMERVQCEASDLHAQAMQRAANGIAFNEVLARLDQKHADLLKALIVDFITGDGASTDKDGIRWREVVRRLSGARKSYEATAVAEACKPLPGAFIDYWEMKRRNAR